MTWHANAHYGWIAMGDLLIPLVSRVRLLGLKP